MATTTVRTPVKTTAPALTSPTSGYTSNDADVRARIAAMQAQAVAQSSQAQTAPRTTTAPSSTTPSLTSMSTGSTPAPSSRYIPAPVTNTTSSANLYSPSTPQNALVVPLAPDPNKSLTAPGGGYATTDPAVRAQIAAMQRAAQGQGTAPATMTLPNANVPTYTPPTTPAATTAPSATVPFKQGLSAAQQQSLTNLSQKPLSQWTQTDYTNWNYGTNNAPPPSGSTIAPQETPSQVGPESSPIATPSPGEATTTPTDIPPAPPEQPSPAQSQYDALLAEYNKSLETLNSPTASEAEAQAALDRLTAAQANLEQSERLGMEKIREQPIELDFITGQQAALERRATNLQTGLTTQMVPLKERLAREQARRQTSLDITSKMFDAQSKRALEQEKADREERVARAKGKEPQVLSPGATLVDPTTGRVIYTAPAKEAQPKFYPATKYNEAGWFDPNTGTFTPISPSNASTRTGGGGGGGSSGSGGTSSGPYPKGWDTEVKSAIGRLTNGEPWGTVWTALKTRFPTVTDYQVDVALGTTWREPGAFEAYRKRQEAVKGSSSEYVPLS